MAAGALRTPPLLARSGVRARMLGKGLRLHPATAIFGVFEHRIEPWHGAPMTAICKEHADLGDGHGAVLEVAPVHPGLASVAIPWPSSAAHARDLAALGRTACAVAFARDRDGGEVRDGNPPTIRYRVSKYDGRNLLEGVAAAGRALLAAGATEVYTTHTATVRLRREDASERAIAKFRERVLAAGHANNRLSLFSAHQMGSARMSARARDGVVDERGGVHGVRGLIVCDASVFPAASGVNPMLTIMAMAHRTASLHA
jgi:choline dehydrogenase-like flavoprotein